MARKAKTNSKSKKTSQSTKTSNYQTAYLILGLMIAFLSLIAIFQSGFIGLLLVNGFRLMVGEAYTLVLFVSLITGLLMSIRGKLLIVNTRRVIGGFLVLLSITAILHLTTFHQELITRPHLSVFDLTFSIYRNEVLTSQNVFSLGGGLLGAGSYAITTYLFGVWGSYVFFFIIFAFGLLSLIDVPLSAGWHALKSVLKNSGLFFRKLFPDFSEVRQVFNEDQGSVANEEKDLKEGKTETHQLIIDSNNQNIDSSDNKTSKSPGSFSSSNTTSAKSNPFQKQWFKFKQFFLGVDADYESYQRFEDYYQSSGQEDFSKEEPVFQPPDDYELKAFSSKDPLAQRANEKRKFEGVEPQILDLDFFDSMKNEETTLAGNSSSQSDGTEQGKDAESSGAKLEDISVIDKSQMENHPGRYTLKKSAEAAEENHPLLKDKETPIPSSSAAASFWQESASSKNALTDDDLDSLLVDEKNDKAFEKSKNKDQKAVKKNRKSYQLPGKELLKKLPPVDQSEEYERINENIQKLELTFESFDVDAKVVKANLGPSVTKYEIQPAVGVKVSKIVNLSDDIALALAARDIRMEAPIPGKSLIGIEVPNNQVSPVAFSEIIDAGLESSNLLEVPLGRDISGSVCLADLSKMPHLLMAGATGSGKSVGMNVIIISLLMKALPEQVKFLMIDPKKVELTLYNDLPHLLAPVVTNPRKAARALNNVVEEMERRYELFAATGVRNIDGFNDYVDEVNQHPTENDSQIYERLPRIVVFIDELADLMMVASKDVETAIIRLAQMARAAGIHMIIATQRPSVDVITGIIKANVPSRLAFAVSSGTDSRTILDSVGAEKLLGRGDMLFQPMGKNKPVRVQGAYISDEEVERITDFIKAQRTVEYDENIVVSEEVNSIADASDDEYFLEAVEMIREQETVSISQLQRKFRIGYNRAARLVDDLESQGMVSPQDGSKPRQVLIGLQPTEED